MNFNEWKLPQDLKDILNKAKSIKYPSGREELINIATGGKKPVFEVISDTGELGCKTDAAVTI